MVPVCLAISLSAGVVAVVAIFDAIGSTNTDVRNQASQRVALRFDTCQKLQGAPVLSPDGLLIGRLEFPVTSCASYAHGKDLAIR